MALYYFPSKSSNQQDKVVKKAVFFDRDGVLNYLVERANGEKTAPWDVSEFDLIPGSKMAVDLVKSLNYKTFVVTNQPDVYDGHLPESHLNIMSRMLKAWLRIDDVYIAYERGSAWYKPNNGMIETVIKQYKIDRGSSYIIGDRWKDIVAGHKSKLNTIFVGHEYTYPLEYQDIQPDYIVDNVLQACTLIAELDNYD
jgi:HAD superfamily hydrolase (TIGR01662 family)